MPFARSQLGEQHEFEFLAFCGVSFARICVLIIMSSSRLLEGHSHDRTRQTGHQDSAGALLVSLSSPCYVKFLLGVALREKRPDLT